MKIGQNLHAQPAYDEYTENGLGDLTPEEWEVLLEQRRERETETDIVRMEIDKLP